MTGRMLAGERGLGIVETMIAITIMAIAFLGMAGVHAVSGRAQALGRNQGLAANLVESDLETMRRTPLSAIAATTRSTSLSGMNFALARTVSSLGAAKRVEVTASWTDRFGPRSIRMATVISGVTNP